MKFIFCMQIIIEAFYKLILSFWVSVTRHAQSTQNKFAYLCNISIKAWRMDFFLPSDKHKSFLQDDSIDLGVHSQASSKYPKQQVYNILATCKENMKDEVDFLPADKCRRFLKSDTISLGVCGQTCPYYPK